MVEHETDSHFEQGSKISAVDFAPTIQIVTAVVATVSGWSPIAITANHSQPRGHCFAAAAEAMRRILVESARPKHGGGMERVTLSDAFGNMDLVALNDALDKLAAKDPRKAELVKLRFFAGFSCKQAAQVLGIAESTVHLDWAYAKTWLRVEIAGADLTRKTRYRPSRPQAWRVAI